MKNNTIVLIDRLINDLQQVTSYLINTNEIRQHSSYINQLKHIKKTVLADPRYPHLIVQNKIDDLFSRDNQIKGASADFLFSELKNNIKNFNPNVRAIF